MQSPKERHRYRAISFYKPVLNILKHIVCRKDINMKKQILLKDIKGLSFIGGQITSRVTADEKRNDPVLGTITVIPPKAIKDGKIVHEDLTELSYKVELDEKKVTREGDIVLKLSTPYDAACITKEDEGFLIPSFCIIIRSNSKTVAPEFLTAFFNSNVYRNQAMAMASGATVPMLTMGKIKEIAIKEFPLEEQKKIAGYAKLLREKEDVMAHIIELEHEKLDTILGGEDDE